MNESLRNEYNKRNVIASNTLHPFLSHLRYYASQCESVVEIGVDTGTSAIAIMAGLPDKFIGIDIRKKDEVIELLYKFARENNIKYEFIQKSSLELEIESTDMLFIDSLHMYEQLKQELIRHHAKVNKFIVLHDTVLCGDSGMDFPGKRYPGHGLMKAVQEFLKEYKEWSILKHYTERFGLMVLKRNN